LAPAAIALAYFTSSDPYYLSMQEATRGMLDPALTPSLRSLIRGLGAGWPLMLAAYCLSRLLTSPRPGRAVSL
jgi:hypothetical protein